MKIFLSGGCKNGKSFYAQRLAKTLAGQGPLYYVATMLPHDKEDDARIACHRAEREGWGFQTLEIGCDIARVLRLSDVRGTYLLDSVTALLSNEMFPPGGDVREDACLAVERGLSAFLDGVAHAVVVSDYIYSDAMRYDALTERYRMGLAHLDRMLARRCDTVAEVQSGNILLHKGDWPL